MEKHEQLLKQFTGTLKKFEEVMEQKENEFIRDSALQRFEFTIELAWKALKACLEWGESVICRSPRSCIKEAYKLGWIDYEQKWIDALRLRNQLVHVYNEKMAEAIYHQLSDILEIFQKLKKNLQERVI